MLEKHALLMKTYGWTHRFVRHGIAGAQSWAYYHWARENSE